MLQLVTNLVTGWEVSKQRCSAQPSSFQLRAEKLKGDGIWPSWHCWFLCWFFVLIFMKFYDRWINSQWPSEICLQTCANSTMLNRMPFSVPQIGVIRNIRAVMNSSANPEILASQILNWSIAEQKVRHRPISENRGSTGNPSNVLVCDILVRVRLA